MTKKLLSLIMVCFLALSAGAATVTFDATADYPSTGGGTAGAQTVTKNGVTITISNGMMNGSQYRCYKGETLTITSTSGNITQAVFTCTASGDTKYGPGCFTAASGTYTYEGKVGTWTGDAASVSLSCPNNQVRATKIEVTVGASDPTYVADPVFSPAAGTYYAAQQVAITSATEGAVVYYTTNGSEPTSASTAYSSPVAVSASTTLKAIAINGDYKSNVVSAAYVIAEPTSVANIAAYNAVTDSTVVKFTNPVSFVTQYNSYLYVKDDSGYALFYGTTGQTYKTGDVIPAGFTGQKVTYSGKPELKVSATDGFQAAVDNNTITPELIQLTDVSEDLWGHLVQINGIKYTSKTACSDNSGTGSWYSSLIASLPDTTGNTTYNATGIVGAFKSSTATTITYQFLPVSNTLASGGLTISQFNDLADNATAVMGSVTVLAQYGQNLYVKDATGYMLIYGSTGQTYSRGDIIPAGFSGTKTTWNGEPELKNPSGFQAATTSETVTPEVVTLASGVVAHENFGHLVKVQNVTINSTDGTLTDAAGSAAYYNNMGASLPTDLTQTYDVIAIIGSYGKTGSTVYQVLPIEFTKPGGGALDLPEVANINALYALSASTNAKITGKLTTIYQNGLNLYVKDEAGTYGLVFGTVSESFTNGDEITGAVASWKTYNSIKEIIPVDSTFTKSGSGAAVEPIEVTAEDISQDMVHQYLVVKSATLTDSTLTDATGVTITLYNKFGISMSTNTSDKYTVKLFPTVYSSKLELYPVEVINESGVADVQGAKQVAAVRYYNLAGQQAAQPFEGVNVVKTIYTDGTTAVTKQVK